MASSQALGISCLATIIYACSLPTANADLMITYVGDGTGNVTGDMDAVGQVTLWDHTSTGDMWNGGDTFTYLHSENQIASSFMATVRIVSQTEAAEGRWGKAGLVARNDLSPNAGYAMTRVTAGNDSQPSGMNPVPVTMDGRTQNDGQGGFENTINDASFVGPVASQSDVFRTDGSVNVTWLSLSYNAHLNEFRSGYASDVSGSPGVWSYSIWEDGVPADGDGWYVGIGYSAHRDMSLPTNDLVDREGLHGVTFDNFNLTAVPEPSGFLGLALIAVGCGVLRKLQQRIPGEV